MQFITNRIHTGKGKSFADLVDEYRKGQEEGQVKTASAEEVVKTAEQEEADSSGQLDVEPLHQKGESTEMPKKGPKAKKEGEDDTSEEKEATVTDNENSGDADSSGQPEWGGKQENNNDPEEPPKEEKGGSAEEETKVAAATCEKCGKTCGECDCPDCDCKPCTTARAEAEVKEAAIEDLPEEVQEKIKGKKPEDETKESSKEEDKEEETKEASAEEDKKEEEKEAESEEDKKEEKEASAPRFVKIASLTDDQKAITAIRMAQNLIGKLGKEATKSYIHAVLGEIKLANLDGKNKSFLTKYWSQLFGEDYVSALVADK